MASCHTHAACCGRILPMGLLAVKILPRISRIYTDVGVRRVSHRIHKSTQMLVPLRGCTCLKCTNRARRAIYSVGAAETAAPPCWRRGYGRMPYPPNLCASVPICGRHFSARMFCVFCVFCGNSLPVCLVMSVVVFSHGFHGFPQKLGCVIGGVGMAGCHTLLICAHLCLSVGGFLYQTVLCVPRILWEYIPACSVGALETSAPPLEVALTALLVHLWAAHLRWFPSAARSVSVRHPIRFRPPSDQIAFAVRSDFVRCTMP